jgi:hypothetical protein
MADVLPFIRQTSFSPEVTHLMGKAYDHAAKILHDKGPPSLEQEALAQRIIFLAGRGERDPRTLARMALGSLGIRST